MHPSCLVFISLLEKCVGNSKFVLGAGQQKKCAVGVLVSNGVMPQDSSPGGVITSHSSVEISEDEKTIPVGHGRYCRAQFRIKRLLFLVRGSHGRCISTNKDSQTAIAELQLESHQAGVDTLWLIRQLRYQRVLNCKTNSMLPRLTLGMSRRVEGIARTELHELAHTRNASFTKRSYIDAITTKFPSNDSRSALMSIQRIQHCAHIPRCKLQVQPTAIHFLPSAKIATANLDNQLAAVSQQVCWNRLCLGILFSPPLQTKRAVLSLNRAALSPGQDTDATAVPGQKQTTITPQPPACRFVTKCRQWYPPLCTRRH